MGDASMDLDQLQIETPRLILRLPRAADLDPWAAMMADEQTARFIGGVMPRSVTWRVLMTMIGAWHATGISMFSVIEKATGRWVGRIGPWTPEGWPGPEVGWAIVRECWGRGYATEGAAAAIDYAFDHLGWDRVIHSISPENAASQAVARKLGSRNLGRGSLPPPFENARIDIWGQSREEWRSRPR
ncbi:MAG TPA: GNAT family N-acetyltransferase [Vicinamibacterales bacterium]|nr:GNAT family N-acetyltransferase [Vicinamibacterales bacterium]